VAGDCYSCSFAFAFARQRDHHDVALYRHPIFLALYRHPIDYIYIASLLVSAELRASAQRMIHLFLLSQCLYTIVDQCPICWQLLGYPHGTVHTEIVSTAAWVTHAHE
jgi:hypothetical protein